MNAVGVNVGGSKTAAGVVTPEGEVLDEARYPSSGPTERLLSDIARAINDVRGEHEIRTATPGPKSVVLSAALPRDGSDELVPGT